MLTSDFLARFKAETEGLWGNCSIDPTIYGFQFQRGTRWNPGLTEAEIAAYEEAVDLRFPDDFRTFLRAMNGTDLPTLNVYGYCGEPLRESVGVYSYPRDLERVRSHITDARENRDEIVADLASQGFHLAAEAGLMPIYGHRYVVCTPDPDRSVVLSIVVHDVDAIVYGHSLMEYLEREFLR